MREYEIVYIFRSNFTPEEIEARIERYHALLTGDGKGEITAVEQWGKRQLAYPIQKQPNGYYVVAQFTADPAALPEFERVITLEEDLLRYLIVLSEGELPVPGSMQAAMDDRVAPPKAGPGDAEPTTDEAPKSDDATAEAAETAEASEESTADSPAEEAADDGSDDEAAGEESANEGDDPDEAGEEEPSTDGDDDTGEDDAAAEGEAGSDDDSGDDAEDDDAADDAAEKEE